ncbi:hypothetical protein [Methylocapsa acidiphila]|uniref:hypothetical protein n=1 Tax=Methylocapsa acidiphila TaxID=133552 RepID=UPI00047EB239|nr:hypothetical protein [Methylocapsa acidiphila]
MAVVKTRILREEWEVEARLAKLQLNKRKLLEVRSTAIAAAADATPFHPANAAGTFSYQHGTFALRNECVGEKWEIDRPNGVEAIRNEAIRVKVVFANVDVACNDEHEPKPRSTKGAGAERLCADNLFGETLPRFALISDGDGWVIYYLMVAPNGAVELSCPVVKGGTFESFVERLYLSDGSDLESEPKLSLDDQDIANDFDPKIARK